MGEKGESLENAHATTRPAATGVAGGVIRWIRKNQSTPLISKVIKPLGRSLMMPFWKNKARAFIKQTVKPGQLVFDVGAHEGNKAELFLEAGARVVCFEPQAELAARLRRKFEGRKDVSVVEKGLSDSEGTVTMFISSEETMVSTLSSDWKKDVFSNYKYDRELSIQTTTLDKMIEQFGVPDYAKIDVEGFEINVLSGLSQQIPLLSIEWALKSLELTERCVRHLEHLGYHQFNVAFGETFRFGFDSWTTPEELLAHLRKPEEELLWGWGDIYAKI